MSSADAGAPRVGLGARPAGTADDQEEWRLFIAVPVPAAIRDAVARIVAGLRPLAPRARWQSSDTWHLTLRFLGQTPAGEVRRLGAILGDLAASTAPFRTELRGAGSFGGGRRPLVAWIGVGAGSEQLAALAASLDRAIDPTGDNHPLRAHLTVAREAPPELAGALREAMAREDRLAWTADRIVLYRSVLGPRGSTHTELASAPLGGRVAGSGGSLAGPAGR